MKFLRKSTIFPNYEARVMAFIIFVLKLLFGLDGVTEHKFSDFADELNENETDSANDSFPGAKKTMFHWENWTKFIKYRQIIVEKYHFQTFFLKNGTSKMINFDTFIAFNDDWKLNFCRPKEGDDEEEAQNGTDTVLKSYLDKLKQLHRYSSSNITFRPSLTPFKSYAEFLLTNHYFLEQDHSFDVLSSTFYTHSVDFLRHPKDYLKSINKSNNLVIRHGGANDLFKFETDTFARKHCMKKCNGGRLMTVALVDSDDEERAPRAPEDLYQAETKRRFRALAKRHRERYEASLKETFDPAKVKHSCRLCDSGDSAAEGDSDDMCCEHFISLERKSSKRSEYGDSYMVHYMPHQRYWMRLYVSVKVSLKHFEAFERNLPGSLKFLLRECARICEQPTLFLYEELNRVELHQSYVVGKNEVGENYGPLIDKVKDTW